MAEALLREAVWQYVVQRSATREILDRDAQLVMEAPTWTLNGPGTATFRAPAGTYVRPASDGRATFGKWDTIITALVGNDVRFRGIVTDVNPTVEGEMEITVDSMSTLPHGVAWLGSAYYGAQVDPGDIMRMIWAHLKSYPNSAAQDVRVVGSTGQKVGTYSTQNAADALTAYNAAVKDYNAAVAAKKATQTAETAARAVYSQRVADVTAANKALAAAKAKRPVDKTAIAAAQARVNSAIAARTAQNAAVDAAAKRDDDAAKVVAAKKVVRDRLNDQKVAANKAKKDDGGAFTLLPWELPDLGETIDTLCSDWGFDWTEDSAWNSDRSGFVTTITVHYPRAGTKRTDLLFSDSVNISEPVTAIDNGDDYANTVVGIGAGEGAASIRREVSTIDGGRARRMKTVSEKAIKTNAAMDRRITPVLTASLKTTSFSSVKVTDTPNVRIGSWALGDDIRIDAEIPYLGAVKIWHRITAFTLDDPEGSTATLTLKLSSTYTYGG